MSRKYKLISIISTILLLMIVVFHFFGLRYTQSIIDKNIEKTRLNLLNTKKEELKKEVEILHKTITNYYMNSNLFNMAPSELRFEKKKFLDYIKSLSSKQFGYYWITDINSNLIVHPTNEKDKLLTIVSDESKKSLAFLYSQIIQKKEDTLNYFLKSNNENIHKVGHVKLFEPWGWVIGKSIELKKINNEIKSLKDEIYKEIEIIFGILLLVLILATLLIAFIIATITDFSIFKHIDKNISNLNISLKAKNEELKKKLYVDELTGLSNLASLKNTLSKLEFATIIMIDIDSFDNINKLYGYNKADRILCAYAAILNQFAMKNNYKAYRLYSNTFAFLGFKENFKIEEYYRDILELINKQNKINILNLSIELDVNIGVSLYQDMPLIKANTALSQAKSLNKRYFVYNETIQDKQNIEKFNIIRDDISYAIENDNIIPFFQPIVNKEKNIEKYEVLMRLKKFDDGKNKIISPYYFLDTAIKTKQYKKLSKIIIEKALNIATEKNYNISLNLSLSDILDRDIIDLLDFYLNIDNIPLCKLITFEILESENIQDIEIVKEFISKYRQLGIKFAIDDFGTGYSNFSNILAIKPDYLKIDGSLIKNINKDKDCLELVKSILSFSKELKISTVVEFVHNEEIFNITKELGVNMFQGYYFSEPKSEVDINDSK